MSERLWIVEPGDDDNRVLLAKRFLGPTWKAWEPETLEARLQEFFDKLEIVCSDDPSRYPRIEYWP